MGFPVEQLVENLEAASEKLERGYAGKFVVRTLAVTARDGEKVLEVGLSDEPQGRERWTVRLELGGGGND